PRKPPSMTNQAPTKKAPPASSTSLIQSIASVPVSGMIVCTPPPAEKATPTTNDTVVRTAQIAPAVLRLMFRIATLLAARHRSYADIASPTLSLSMASGPCRAPKGRAHFVAEHVHIEEERLSDQSWAQIFGDSCG